MRPNAVKQLLRTGKPAVGTWLSLGNVTVARFLARARFA
jgi:4-hydroxy-2-oxoheptanedioate aldolase